MNENEGRKGRRRKTEIRRKGQENRRNEEEFKYLRTEECNFGAGRLAL